MNAMNVLVSVASRHGATSEIGGALARRLRGRGLDVTTLPPESVTELEPYDAIVLGSAVYMGHWLPQAADFVERHLLALHDRPVWLFSSGPLGNPLVPAGDAPEVGPMVQRLGAREHRTFAGELQQGVIGFKERMIVKMVKAPYGDFRDWAAIDAWADAIAEALVPVIA